MLIPNRLRFLLPASVMALAVPAFCQPSATYPPEYAKANCDGVGGITAGDFQCFLNIAAIGSAYDAQRPYNALNVAASVSGPAVTVTWQNPGSGFGQPATDRYVVWTGGNVRVDGAATTAQVQPGAGTWTFAVVTRRITPNFVYEPVTAAPTMTATVVTAPPPPAAGWTQFIQDAGSRTMYVSAAGTGTACTEASPCALTQGLSLARNGTTDAVLLKAGDTFNIGTVQLTKGSGTAGKYLRIGSYGTGRAIVRGTFNAEATGIRGVAFTDLEFVGTNAVGSWFVRCLRQKDYLFEGCSFHNNSRAIIFQGFDIQSSGFKVRRCTFYDITAATCDPAGSTNCPQAIYCDLTDDVLIEENFFDKCGIPGNLYTRPVYLQSNNGGGVIRSNVFSRNPAEGFQLRAGGTAINNLCLDNPINMYVGHEGTAQNVIEYNVCMGSGSVGPTNGAWGRGIHYNGPTSCRFNVIAYNTGLGWGNVEGIKADAASGVLSDNYIREWTRDPAWGGQGDPAEARSISTSGGPLTVTNNRVFMGRQGIVLEGSGATDSANQYAEPSGSLPTFRPNATRNGWSPVALPADPNLKSLLPGGGIDAYCALTRGQSRFNWRGELVASEVNKILRDAAGVAQPVNP